MKAFLRLSRLPNPGTDVYKRQIEYRDNEGGGSVFTVCIPTDKTVYEEKDFLVAGNVLLQEADSWNHHLEQLPEELPEQDKMRCV